MTLALPSTSICPTRVGVARFGNMTGWTWHVSGPAPNFSSYRSAAAWTLLARSPSRVSCHRSPSFNP
jgi:hypothetical protein